MINFAGNSSKIPTQSKSQDVIGNKKTIVFKDGGNAVANIEIKLSGMGEICLFPRICLEYASLIFTPVFQEDIAKHFFLAFLMLRSIGGYSIRRECQPALIGFHSGQSKNKTYLTNE